MGKYVRAEHVDAFQIEFSDADKEAAKQGLAVSSHGNHIKHEDGVFSVLIHLGDDAKQAKEGEWVVTEKSGNKKIETDEDFASNYFERDEDEGAGDVEEQEQKPPELDVPPVLDNELVLPPVVATPEMESGEAKTDGSETAAD